jgi:hypothetical protein
MPKKIILIVVGSLMGLTGLLATISGAAVLAALGPHNTIQSTSHVISTPANAVVSPAATIRNEAGFASAFGTPTIHLHVTAATPGGVFIGIAPAIQVDRYLAGVPIAVVNDLDTPPTRPGTQARTFTPPPASHQSFWVAQATGTAAADLTWTPTDGTYRVVVMRGDAQPGVNLQARVGLSIPTLANIGTGLVVGGSIVLLLGVAALLLGMRAKTTPAKTKKTPAAGVTPTSPTIGAPLA